MVQWLIEGYIGLIEFPTNKIQTCVVNEIEDHSY